MYLKQYKQNKSSTMKSTITQVLLFHNFKICVYPFPMVQVLNPYHAEFVFLLCVCREGGCCYVVVFAMLFFSKSKLANKDNLVE